MIPLKSFLSCFTILNSSYIILYLMLKLIPFNCFDMFNVFRFTDFIDLFRSIQLRLTNSLSLGEFISSMSFMFNLDLRWVTF